MAESLTLPQRSEYWPLDERDTVLGFPLTFIPQHRAKADISMLVKADIFILGRQRVQGSHPCCVAVPRRMEGRRIPLRRGEGRQALGWVIDWETNPPRAKRPLSLRDRCRCAPPFQGGNRTMSAKSIPTSSSRSELLCLPRFAQTLPLCGVFFSLKLRPRLAWTNLFLV